MARRQRGTSVLLLVVFGVVVVVIAVVAGASLVRGTSGSGSGSATPAGPGPVAPVTETVTASPSTSVALTHDVAAPVSYVGTAAAGPRLFREPLLLQGVTPAQELQRAVQQAVGGTPLDPDYRSAWPGGTTASVTSSSDASSGGVTVDLRGSTDALVGAPADPALGTLAVQAVVRTVDDVLGSPAPVTFTVQGLAVPTVVGVDASAPVAAADPLQVVAPVSVESPANGATVGRTFTVSGTAATFEANVVWELKQGSRVVKQGHATAEQCCTPSPYSFTVTAPPATPSSSTTPTTPARVARSTATPWWSPSADELVSRSASRTPRAPGR